MGKIASAARHGMAYIVEATPGVTPAAPAMRALRHTSCDLNLSRDSFTSAELRTDRQINDVRTGTDKIAGSIGFEPSWGEYDPLLEACLAGTWEANVLKCGVVERSLTIERAFTDIGQYVRYRGCYVNKLSLSLQPNAMVTGKFEFVGLSGETAHEPLASQNAPSATGRPYDSYRGELKEAGETIAVVTGIELSLDNGIQPQFVLFQRAAPFVSWGLSTVTGTMTAFFEDVALIQKFLDETPTSLEFTLGFPEEGLYRVTLPAIRYTGADNPVEQEGPVSLSMPFSAVLDPVSGTNMIIERLPAAGPETGGTGGPDAPEENGPEDGAPEAGAESN